MDSDEWDDDIADEDLITALTQTSQTPPETTHASSSRPTTVQRAPPRVQTVNASSSFRQTTLWGAPATEQKQSDAPQSQVQSKRVYRTDMPVEPPTHHKLNQQALKTWVYPTNLGPVRDYQFSIVKNGLFNNTLVALPTGLGKTFIAATIILNFFRWTQDAKLIFVAPTKPLASQQVEACLNVAGIPRSQATLLTGETSPALREGEWEKRRLFFMTPQTLQNDLSKGYANPKAIALLVIDEAHRATGDYAYVKVVEFLRRFNPSFRVLALTATPGSTVEGVQAVIDSLGISTIEIRTEESIDIRRYVHSRDVNQVVLEPSDEMLQVQDLFSQTLRPLCNKLAQVNKWLARDPMTLTVMGLREAQKQWHLGAARHANPSTKGMLLNVFAILQSLAHSIKLLNYHGIVPFYHKMVDFRSEVEQDSKSKYKRQITQDEHFREMMDTISKWLKLDGFVGHPKLSYLCENLLNHFMDAGEGSSTRAIVFSEYRDSAEEIVRTLNKHKPLIKATIFVGQADSKRSEGMKQKQQIETIEKFRSGEFNVLVATSIGEEGLDIGQVDLIICYDASASPIRMLQRMGRTGRKRAGNITLLLMKGREEEQYRKAKDNYEKMQRFICEGTRFNFRNDLSARIVPREVKPEVEMRMVEIPIENTQDTSLPEPKKGTATRKKATQKKFHMPDGVVTGFLKASDVGKAGAATVSRAKKPTTPLETDSLVEVPSFSTVLLDRKQMAELDKAYRNLPAQRASQEDVTGPDLGAQPKAQRRLGPVAKVKHGTHTKRCVKLFKALANAQSPWERHVQPYSEEYRYGYKQIPLPTFADDTEEEAADNASSLFTGTSSKRQRTHLVDEDADDSPPKRRKAGSKSKMGTGQRSNPRNPFIGSSDDDDGASFDNFKENEFSRAQEKRPNSKAKAKAKSRGGAARSGRNADTFEDYGDDCTRTSQLYESDGSDSGADLVDFIDDGPLPSMQPSSSFTSTSPATVVKSPKKKPKEDHPFYEFMSITSSQDSDDDLASLSQLGRPKSATNPVLAESEEENKVQKRPVPGRRKRQAVVDDSDDDCE